MKKLLILLYLQLVSVSGWASGLQPYELYMPKDTSKPVPLIVVAHSCAGFSQNGYRNWREWAEWANKKNFAAVLIDSWTGRSFGDVCSQPSLANTIYPVRVKDSYEVATEIANTKNIDKSKIFLIGGSHGGRLAYEVLTKNSVDQFPSDRYIRFAGAIGLYPGCSAYMSKEPTQSPLLLIVGEIDDWTLPQHCYNLASTAKYSKESGYDINIEVIKDAGHSFDYYWVQTVMRGIVGQGGKVGVSIGGTRAQRKEAEQLIESFLEKVNDKKIAQRTPN